VLAAAAGAPLGVNRSERGMPAGLRTTLLVCLAASVAMTQANLLLGTAGRPIDSFVRLDPMRLPLGVLTGMGFIGGGAILRRGELVRGVTTAATLWLATVIGLCFGGGQAGLGLAAARMPLIDQMVKTLAAAGVGPVSVSEAVLPTRACTLAKAPVPVSPDGAILAFADEGDLRLIDLGSPPGRFPVRR
jgi:uncharacterized membrane protein YhiD involved in acid resistance